MGQTNERTTSQVAQDPTVAIPEGCVFEDVCNVVWSFTDGAPFLYLGNKWSALFPIDEYNKRTITHIVNVTENEINMHEKTLQYLKISVPDEEKVDIKEHFDRTYQFIKEAYNNKQSVLVHCYAGMSRSTTIVLSFIMKEFGLDLKQALVHVAKQRPCILPNNSFFNKLAVLEKELTGNDTCSISLEDFQLQTYKQQ